MSKEFVKKFRKDLEENEELKEKLKKELETFKDSGKKEKELIPEIARKLGYDFTDEEFKEECTNSKKLNDEELANVSGGYFFFGEDAPDGHEVNCYLCYYEGMGDYYYTNHVCEACGSTNTTGFNSMGEGRYVKCHNCGHKTIC